MGGVCVCVRARVCVYDVGACLLLVALGGRPPGSERVALAV